MSDTSRPIDSKSTATGHVKSDLRADGLEDGETVSFDIIIKSAVTTDPNETRFIDVDTQLGIAANADSTAEAVSTCRGTKTGLRGMVVAVAHVSDKDGKEVLSPPPVSAAEFVCIQESDAQAKLSFQVKRTAPLGFLEVSTALAARCVAHKAVIADSGTGVEGPMASPAPDDPLIGISAVAVKDCLSGSSIPDIVDMTQNNGATILKVFARTTNGQVPNRFMLVRIGLPAPGGSLSSDTLFFPELVASGPVTQLGPTNAIALHHSFTTSLKADGELQFNADKSEHGTAASWRWRASGSASMSAGFILNEMTAGKEGQIGALRLTVNGNIAAELQPNLGSQSTLLVADQDAHPKGIEALGAVMVDSATGEFKVIARDLLNPNVFISIACNASKNTCAL